MKLLFYSSGNDPNFTSLDDAVRQAIPVSQIELFNTLADLEERLRRPVEPDSIAVLSISNRKELQKMQLLRKLLPEIYVVLVIPDRKRSTLALAHLLLPRFLSRNDSAFADLEIVLHKMYINSLHPPQGELSSEA